MKIDESIFTEEEKKAIDVEVEKRIKEMQERVKAIKELPDDATSGNTQEGTESNV
jgi:hypothetical protein